MLVRPGCLSFDDLVSLVLEVNAAIVVAIVCFAPITRCDRRWKMTATAAVAMAVLMLEWPQLQNLPLAEESMLMAPSAPPPVKPSLWVIIVGEMFREGGQLTRLSNGSISEQMGACRTWRTHALRPLINGWSVSLVVDVHTALGRSRVDECMRGATDSTVGRVHHMRVSSATLRTQVDGRRASLELLRHAMRARRDEAAPVLMLRADLFLLRVLPLPFGLRPWREPTFDVAVPWQISCAFRGHLRHMQTDPRNARRPRVADTFLLIMNVTRFANELQAARRRAQTHMHDLCTWHPLRCARLVGEDYDSDPQKQPNPYYSCVGRRVPRFEVEAVTKHGRIPGPRVA